MKHELDDESRIRTALFQLERDLPALSKSDEIDTKSYSLCHLVLLCLTCDVDVTKPVVVKGRRLKWYTFLSNRFYDHFVKKLFGNKKPRRWIDLERVRIEVSDDVYGC